MQENQPQRKIGYRKIATEGTEITKMEVMEWLKQFSRRVLSKIVDHLAHVVAGFAVVAALALSAIFWRWLTSKHSLSISGWLWVLMFLLISSLPILSFWLTTKKPWKPVYTDEGDIKSIIELEFREFSGVAGGIYKPRLTIRFDLFDRISKVKTGSSKRHLETIANGLGYRTTRTGAKTIVFEYEDRSISRTIIASR